MYNFFVYLDTIIYKKNNVITIKMKISDIYQNIRYISLKSDILIFSENIIFTIPGSTICT